MTVVLVLILHTIPALATEIVCYSIASCTLALSSGLIQENSSIVHTPQSANTRAPASRMYSFPSLKAATVRPADVEPIPFVITARVDIRVAALRNWLLPVPGSPTIIRWIVPLTFISFYSSYFCDTPPINVSKIPSFSSNRSKMVGQTDSIIIRLPWIWSFFFQNRLNSFKLSTLI